MSLTCDYLEERRPALTEAVMRWMAARTFRKDDFAAFEGGVVRLSSEVARDVARVVLQAISIKEYDSAARAGPHPNGTGLTKSRSSSAPGAAYRRGDALEKRRGLIDEWAMFCGSVKTGVGRAA